MYVYVPYNANDTYLHLRYDDGDKVRLACRCWQLPYMPWSNWYGTGGEVRTTVVYPPNAGQATARSVRYFIRKSEQMMRVGGRRGIVEVTYYEKKPPPPSMARSSGCCINATSSRWVQPHLAKRGTTQVMAGS